MFTDFLPIFNLYFCLLCAGEVCNSDKVIKRLLSVCDSMHHRIIDHLTEQDFKENYGPKLEWTGCKENLIECFNLIKRGDPTDTILSMLLLTSSLEHCLGDVYISFSSDSQCPSLLKDLLATKELEDILGSVAVNLLRVLVGPPSGLNLRNILWHGFAAPSEVPPQ